VLIQVSQHLQQPTGYQASYELCEPSLRLDDDSVLSDLNGQVTLLRTDCGLLAYVTADCALRGSCSRCLVDIEYRLAIEFQEEYLPTIDINTGLHLPIDTSTDNFVIDADFSLDLGEALRQYKVMGESAKPLCQPDCRGLCPHCGQNLNLEPCGCPPEQDRRWEALLGLGDKIKQTEGS
jgi:uncharacterized protein